MLLARAVEHADNYLKGAEIFVEGARMRYDLSNVQFYVQDAGRGYQGFLRFDAEVRGHAPFGHSLAHLNGDSDLVVDARSILREKVRGDYTVEDFLPFDYSMDSEGRVLREEGRTLCFMGIPLFTFGGRSEPMADPHAVEGVKKFYDPRHNSKVTAAGIIGERRLKKEVKAIRDVLGEDAIVQDHATIGRTFTARSRMVV